VRACASVQQSYGIARGICHPRSKPSSIPCDSDWVLGSHEWFSDLGRAEIPVPQDRQVLHPLHSADASRCGRIHRRRHRRLVLSGSAGLAFMSYARPPKTHDGITEKVAVIWREPPLRPPGKNVQEAGPAKGSYSSLVLRIRDRESVCSAPWRRAPDQNVPSRTRSCRPWLAGRSHNSGDTYGP
jgi:hypothetical protein